MRVVILKILNSAIVDSTHIPIGISSWETRKGLVITQSQGDAPRARIIGQSTSRDIIPRRHQAVEGQYLGYRYLITPPMPGNYLCHRFLREEFQGRSARETLLPQPSHPCLVYQVVPERLLPLVTAPCPGALTAGLRVGQSAPHLYRSTDDPSCPW